MSTTAETAREAEVTHLPVNKIRAGENPRKTADDASQRALNDSVRQYGVITPVTVKRSEDGDGWDLIAGQRRLIASLTNNLETIPAIVLYDVDDDDRRRAVAMVENLHREPLKPMEEARAFKDASATLTPKHIAAAYSISEQTVRDRIALLSLPEELHEHIDSGAIPIGASRVIARIAEHDERIGHACAASILSGQIGIGQFGASPKWALQNAVRAWNLENTEDFILLWQANGNELDPQEVGWSDDQVDQVMADAAVVHDAYDWTPLLTPEEIDAAREFGCLLELSSDDGEDYAFITSPDWLFEYGSKALARKAQVLRDNPPKQTRSSVSPGPARRKKADMTEQERSEYDEQRAKDEEAREHAVADNTKLGANLMGKLRVKADKRTMLLLALVIGQRYADTIGRGLRFTVEELRTVTEKRSGGSRIEYVTPADAYEWWLKRLHRLKTADEILHHIVAGLAAAEFVDEQCVPRSARTWSSPAGGGNSEIAELLMAVTRAQVPQRMKDRAAEHAKTEKELEDEDDLL